MLEIVHDILEAEQKAETTLRTAKEEAEKLRAEAESEANKFLAEARSEARRIAGERIEQAREQSSGDAEKALEEERKKVAVFADVHSVKIDALVSEIAKLIIETDPRDS